MVMMLEVESYYEPYNTKNSAILVNLSTSKAFIVECFLPFIKLFQD